MSGVGPTMESEIKAIVKHTERQNAANYVVENLAEFFKMSSPIQGKSALNQPKVADIQCGRYSDIC